MQWLYDQGYLQGHMLDYGCGKGFDADYFGMDKYDPFYFPNTKYGTNVYDVITCNYVLNVIPTSHERESTLHSIRNLLKPNGIAYISIRADKNKLNGVTTRGTWQQYVGHELPSLKLDLVRHVSNKYEIWRMYKKVMHNAL